MDEFAKEYTPEMSKSYLASLLQPIDDFSRVDEGRATAEAASRGLLGQAYEGSAIGAVRSGARNEKARTIGAFNLDVANKMREERLGSQSRGYAVEDRNFASVEAEKMRNFQQKMAEMGYMHDDASARRDKVYGEQGLLEGGAMTIGVNALNPGNWLGGKH